MSDASSVVLAAVGDPESPATWSGTAAGVLGGLRALGVSGCALDLTLPAGVEQAVLLAGAARTLNRYDAQSAPVTRRLRGALARRRLHDAEVDGAIQIGTTFGLPEGIPFVTLEDMTLRQAVAIHPVFGRMSPRAIERFERFRADVYARASMCCAASWWVAESLREDYGVADERIAVVGLGANHRFQEAPRREWAPARGVFVGIDWERKGGPELLRAFARLREHVPDASLDLVGGHPPVRQAGVRAHGMLSRESERDRALIGELFAKATCFAMPSRVEPFGIVHVEAASAGIPSIATSAGGPRDVLGADGGLVVEPGDEDGLCEAMRRMAEPETARRMGEAARERSLLFTWEKTAARLLGALGIEPSGGCEPVAFL